MSWTKRKYMLLGASILVIAAIGVAASVEKMRSHPSVPADPAVIASVTVPEHTQLQVVLNQAISSDQNRPGDHFTATISEPIVVDDRTVIPQGAEAEGIVVDVKKSGRLRGQARLNLALESVNVNGAQYDIRTTSAVRVGERHKKRNIEWIAGAGAGGALIGAIAGGGKGALIGGPIGAGAGTAVAFITGKKDIHLRPETRLTFRLAEPVTINSKA